MKEGSENGSWQQQIERLITSILTQQDTFRTGLAHLMRAQVFLTETQQRSDEKLTEAQRRIEVNLAEATDKLNALIAFIDGMVRPPPPRPAPGL